MSEVLDAVPGLMAYEPSLIAAAFLCVAVLLQSFVTAPLSFLKEEQVPGMPLKGDHGLLSFRALRAYQNSVENLPMFALGFLLAVLLQLDATVVNWLCILHVVFRVAFALVYYSGVGRVAGGARTLCYVGGLLANIGLAGYCLYVLLAR